MREHLLYIDGTFMASDNAKEIRNPYDGTLISIASLAGENEYELAVNKAVEVFPQLKRLPAFKRSGALSFIADELDSQQHVFAQLISQEAAKPYRYAIGEVNRAIQTFRVAAGEALRLSGEYISLDWTAAGEGKEGWVKQVPVGPVAGISPFNFPLNLAVHKIAPAIAAGCPIVLKPSSNTPLSTLELAKIIAQTELPAGSVSVIPMDRQTGNRLVTDPRFRLLSFTGSPAVGWKMKAEAGKKKVLLELGGNAGVMVSDSADLDLAVKKCLVGAFAYSGQVCIHTQRIYVHQKVFDRFSDIFIKGVNGLKQGPPADSATEISAMIDQKNAIRVEEWVNEAIESGAELLAGGKRKGTFFEPTVLTHTQPEMKVCGLEVFGPVVVLEKFNSFEQAIHEINNSRYGLQAGLFTDSLKEINQAFEQVDVGGLIINDVPTFRVDHMPYGGMKDSGLGREGVKYTLQEMTEPKILVKDF
jgi:glyceraldehyde-3-phosphate dehydrogenase (NADP+)